MSREVTLSWFVTLEDIARHYGPQFSEWTWK
jgi:hypothetical protein